MGPTGPEHRKLAKLNHPFTEITYVVATGYGRVNVPFADRQITEISCHARGVASLMPTVRTVIDVGGQDCKGIKLRNGKAIDFAMNDKCAAGTGRFLEVIAEALGIGLEDMAVTGGGAMNIGLVSALEAKLGYPVLIPAEPLLTSALGAALLAMEKTKEGG